MIDKALLIMIFMWTFSFIMLGVHYSLADVMHVDIVAFCLDDIDLCQNQNGQPLKPLFAGALNDGNVNQVIGRATVGDYGDSGFDRFVQFSVAAAYVAWDIVLILTGTYLFSMIYYMGVPLIFVSGITFIYYVLLIRAILGYVRGV